jgi:hypothetical protein
MAYWETTGQSDEWYTPKHVFDALGVTFDLDVAAPAEGSTFVPCSVCISERSLEKTWQGFVWMNPPFGGRNGLKPWLDKFFAHGNGVALAPDRTSAPWFHEAWAKADLALFTRKLRFHRPDGTVGTSPSNGTALFAAGEKAVEALMRAANAGLGIVAKPVMHRIRETPDVRLQIASIRLKKLISAAGGRFSEVPNDDALEMVRFLDARQR